MCINDIVNTFRCARRLDYFKGLMKQVRCVPPYVPFHFLGWTMAKVV